MALVNNYCVSTLLLLLLERLLILTEFVQCIRFVIFYSLQSMYSEM